MIQYSQLRPSLFFTFILGAPLFTLAQPASTQQDDSIDSSTMAILVLVVLSALLFLGSFSLWIQNCCDSAIPYNRSLAFRSVALGGGSRARQTRHDRDSPGGVDKELIDSFPTIIYSAMKDMKICIGSLDCAVCLSEFSGDELLRLLPSCDHAFHPHCIATWLANHNTCPVCRAKVVNNSRIPMKMEAIVPIATAIQGERNLASVSEGSRYCERLTLKAGLKLKLKRSASCEYLGGEGSGSRWIGRSERWSSSVVAWDCLSVKGDGTGDGLGLLPV